MSAVTYPHIEFVAGVAFVAGTRTKVIEIALDRIAYHWDADEIQRQHPHLSLAQIYSALTYYCDHQAAMDQQIQEQLRDVDFIKANARPSTLRLKLKAKGQLP